MLSGEEYQESIVWKFGRKKDAGTSIANKKTLYEIIKRILVGLFVGSVLINTYLYCTLTMGLCSVVIALIVQSELLTLDRNEKKD